MSGSEDGIGAAPPPGDGSGDEGSSVFGNLPRSRPAVRSPRRTRPRPTEGRTAATEEQGAEAGGGREAEVEALARAGISLAAGAATLGLRAASRAASALRDAVERR